MYLLNIDLYIESPNSIEFVLAYLNAFTLISKTFILIIELETSICKHLYFKLYYSMQNNEIRYSLHITTLLDETV